MRLKIFVFVEPTPEGREKIRGQGLDPDWACACKVVHLPGGTEPSDDLLEAARFAAEARPGDTIVVDPAGGPKHRAPVVGRFTVTQGGRSGAARFLVGLAAPGTAREHRPSPTASVCGMTAAADAGEAIQDEERHRQFREALARGEDVVVVNTLGYRNGRVGPVTDIVPRAEAVRRLGGNVGRQLRADPALRVLGVLDPDLIRRWLSPEEFRALMANLPPDFLKGGAV
jgi:hypothetical protein